MTVLACQSCRRWILTGDNGYDIFLEPCGLSQHLIKYLEVSIVYRNSNGD